MNKKTLPKLSQVEWQKLLSIYASSDTTLDQFEWVILNALNKGNVFEFNKPYDIEQKGKGFKSGKIQLIRDTRDSKLFVSSFHVDRANGTNKLANVTVYKFERKRDENTSEMTWTFAYKIPVDNRSKYGYPLNKLQNYIRRQLSLDGHKLDSQYAKVLEAKSESDLVKQADVIEKVQNLSDVDKLNEILSAVIANKSVVLSSDNYQKLVESRYSPQKIADFEADLIEFRQLVDTEETTETDMQQFLGSKSQDRSWFFGLDYIKTYPKFNPGLPYEYDFLLRRFNLVFDIVELKGPNAEIITLQSESPRQKPDSKKNYAYSVTFGRALYQVIDYMQKYEQHFELVEEQNPSVIDFNGGRFPRGIIVISKRDLVPNYEDLHKLNKQFSSIDVMTYDDLYDRAENIFKFIKKISLTE